MSTPNNPERPRDGTGRREPRTVEEITDDIADARERLGDTAAALYQKFDLAGQARGRLRSGRRRVRDGVGQARAVTGAAGAWARSATTDKQGKPYVARTVVIAGLVAAAAVVPAAAVWVRRRRVTARLVGRVRSAI